MSLGRRDFFGALAVLALGSAARAAVGAEGRRILYVLPLGAPLPAKDTELVQKSLEAFYALDVKHLGKLQLPKSAFYRPRARYRAEKLLDFLATRLPEDGFRILGLTAVDISTEKPPHADWGILGLAKLDDVPCVVSKLRTGRKAKSVEHARIRLAKVCVHETGHTLGLEHCPNQGCLMEDAGGSVLTTDREQDLCSECRGKLKQRSRLGDGGPPW